jgi:hypothetical protein
MQLIKELMALKEGAPDVKALILEAVKRTLDVRGAQGADPYVEGNRITWGVRYDFPEHGEDIEQEINHLLRPIGGATFELVSDHDEDDEDNFNLMAGEAVYQAEVTLIKELTGDEAKDIEAAMEKLLTEDGLNESAGASYEGKNLQQHLDAFYKEQPDEKDMLENSDWEQGSFESVTYYLDAEGQTVHGIEIAKCPDADSVLIYVTGSEDDEGQDIPSDDKYFVVDTSSWRSGTRADYEGE